MVLSYEMIGHTEPLVVPPADHTCAGAELRELSRLPNSTQIPTELWSGKSLVVKEQRKSEKKQKITH